MFIKKSLLALALLFVSFAAIAENWVELERVGARSYAGPIHYQYLPAHYEKETEQSEKADVFVPPVYRTMIPIYNQDYDILYWHTDYSELIYRRLNKRPSIEVAYEIVTYIGQESREYKIEFENVAILVR